MKATKVQATIEMPTLHCCICQKPMQAPYGRWRDCDGTCSKKCEIEKEKDNALPRCYSRVSHEDGV
jgi:hypothetical protein